jgi:hypothetical protein
MHKGTQLTSLEWRMEIARSEEEIGGGRREEEEEEGGRSGGNSAGWPEQVWKVAEVPAAGNSIPIPNIQFPPKSFPLAFPIDSPIYNFHPSQIGNFSRT